MPTLTTRDVPPRDRAELIREAIWRSVVEVEIDHRVPAEQIGVQVRLTDFGAVGVCSVESTPARVGRTPRLARRDDEPAIFVGLQVSGSSMVIQNGREATISAGQFALYDTTEPYSLLFDGGIDQHFFRLPRSMFAMPDRALALVTAVALGAGDPVASFAAGHLSRLAAGADSWTEAAAAAMARPTVELLRAVVTTRLGDHRGAREWLDGTLRTRVMDYLRRHLADPDLSAARIAAAHHISVRSLYTVLAHAGVMLGDWIRAERLELARAELARPDRRTETIASIARGCGFSDATHFGRVFHAAYGLTPRDWRRLTLTPR